MSGAGGIRTPGTLVGLDDLANRCFRPLSHRSKTFEKYALPFRLGNLEIQPVLPAKVQ